MIGIVATIIAAKKGHSVFAWIMGIWSALEIIAILCEYPIAFGPGAVFLVIAIVMKNKNSDKNIIIKPTVKHIPQSAYQKCNTVSAVSSSTGSITPTVQWGAFDVCPLCHNRQKAGLERCLSCNARIMPKVAPSAENWNHTESDDTENDDAQGQEVVALPQASEQELIPITDQPTTRFCRKCGFQLLSDSDFCSYCGAKVISVPQSSVTTEMPEV